MAKSAPKQPEENKEPLSCRICGKEFPGQVAVFYPGTFAQVPTYCVNCSVLVEPAPSWWRKKEGKRRG